MQTWEYSPTYAIRSYAYLWLHALPACFHAKILQTNKVSDPFPVWCSLSPFLYQSSVLIVLEREHPLKRPYFFYRFLFFIFCAVFWLLPAVCVSSTSTSEFESVNITPLFHWILAFFKRHTT